MAFRGRKNDRDVWQKFVGDHPELVGPLGRLSSALSSRPRFEDLLQLDVEDRGPTLADLTDDEWPIFDQLVQYFHREVETNFVTTRYPAYFRERARRSNAGGAASL